MNATLNDAGWRWEHSYAELPELMFERTLPVPVAAPEVVIFNHQLAADLGLDAELLTRGEMAGVFTGNIIPPGADPIAQAYAGHQFGNFTSLGDGRAILLGEHLAPDGKRFDIQLKGPGRTPFSRGGDGRAALGPMLREYLISEAMHGLGIPTTRSLAVASTGEMVLRSEPLPGAVLTRVAASHIRVGTFQWAAAHEDLEALKALADHTRKRHFPEIADGEEEDFRMFEAVMKRQAALVAKWLHVGFIHGVMNTDNMALSGETIDYGPCAFLDAYDPTTVFSSIDRHGRYAYGQQGAIARWNLARLAEAMLPLFHPDEKRAIEMANESLSTFADLFQQEWLNGMRAKIGLHTKEEDDEALIQDLLTWMKERQMDFTNTFRTLGEGAAPPFPDEEFHRWHARWSARRGDDFEAAAILMRSSNPSVIARNHKVEEALAAAEAGDPGPAFRLLEVLRTPYMDNPGSGFASPAPRSSEPYKTFCGT